jgi:hypothetical protein
VLLGQRLEVEKMSTVLSGGERVCIDRGLSTLSKLVGLREAGWVRGG